MYFRYSPNAQDVLTAFKTCFRFQGHVWIKIQLIFQLKLIFAEKNKSQNLIQNIYWPLQNWVFEGLQNRQNLVKIANLEIYLTWNSQKITAIETKTKTSTFLFGFHHDEHEELSKNLKIAFYWWKIMPVYPRLKSLRSLALQNVINNVDTFWSVPYLRGILIPY